jgi:peptide deformylase
MEDSLNPNVLAPAMDNQLLEEYEVLRDGNRLNMRYWDDTALSNVCRPVTTDEFGGQLKEFGDLLLATLKHHGNGLGLAAPQVGLTKRLFAMRFPSAEDLTPVVLVNPVITKKEGREVGQEGCLSIPSIYDQVERAAFVRVEFQWVNGQEGVYDLEGLDARIVQHEIDHLDGIMFFQRMSKQMRKNVLRQWEKIRSKHE